MGAKVVLKSNPVMKIAPNIKSFLTFSGLQISTMDQEGCRFKSCFNPHIHWGHLAVFKPEPSLEKAGYSNSCIFASCW